MTQSAATSNLTDQFIGKCCCTGRPMPMLVHPTRAPRYVTNKVFFTNISLSQNLQGGPKIWHNFSYNLTLSNIYPFMKLINYYTEKMKRKFVIIV